MQLHKYYYDGPVKIFDQCVSNHWKGETTAISESKARSNLSYRYKKTHNLVASTKVILPGEIRMIE